MGSNPDFLLLVIAGIIGLFAHVALAISARYINPLWTLAGVFFVMVPLSMSTSLPGFTIFKYGRTYVGLLAIAIAIFMYRNYRFRGISLAWVAFNAFYVFAAVWSEQPIPGIMFKSLTAICVVAGVLTVYQTTSLEDLKKSMRVVLCFTALFTLIITWAIVTGYGSRDSNDGRLYVLGMTPNRLGGEGAAMFMFCCLVSLYDRSKFWKALSLVCGTILVFAVMRTGSRGAAGMGVIGAFVIALPMVKRPLLLITVGGVVATGLYFILPSDAGQVFQGREWSRANEWGMALEHFRQNPVIGAGWVFSDTSGRGLPSTSNMHSFYLQILAETGILGMLLFVIIMVAGFIKGLGVLAALRHDKELFPWAFAAAALIGAPLAHGLGEASTLTGGAITSVMLAMGFAFLDRLPEMARERAFAAEAHQLEVEWHDHEQQQIIDQYTAHPA